MKTDDGSSKDGLRCVSCDSEDTETLDDGRRRCLDCGALFEVAPGGTPVYSRRVWTVTNLGIACLSGVAFAAALATLVVDQPLFAVVFVVLGTGMLGSNWRDIRALCGRGMEGDDV